MKTDAIIVGSGPNGLAAAIELARHGLSVTVLEEMARPGGGARTQPGSLPGFIHDHCSAVYPLAAASPFFQELPLERFGLRWIHSPIVLAHPAARSIPPMQLRRSLDETIELLNPSDARHYKNLFKPLLDHPKSLLREILTPPLSPFHIPENPVQLLRFAASAIRSAEGLVKRFHEESARALLGGIAAHSGLPLFITGSSSMALVLALAGHAYGWPIAAGGAQALTHALVEYLKSLGGNLFVNHPVHSAADLPKADLVLFDLSVPRLLEIVGDRLGSRFTNDLLKFRAGPGVFKMDWELSGPIPWRDPECLGAATVHLGGSFEEIAASEEKVASGQVIPYPFVILVQPSLFDPSRAPPGKHTAWAYCHVPLGWATDVSEAIENQVERFAPGFRGTILSRRALSPSALESENRNFKSGDISGGAPTVSQLLFRPVSALRPYDLPKAGWYLCSSSTPPGPGVHGMCGYHAARAALARVRENHSGVAAAASKRR